MGIRTRKVILRMLMVLLVIITVFLIVRAFFNYTLGRKLDAAIKQAKADGIPVSSWDLAPACSDSENGAPLWRAAEALFSVSKGPEMASAQKAVECLYVGSPIEDSVRGDLLAWISRNRKVLGLIGDASAMRCFRFDPPGKRSFEKYYPDTKKLIQMTRLVALESVFRAESGDIEGAMDQCRRGFRFLNGLSNSDCNFLINDLIAISARKLLIASFNRIAQGLAMDSAVLSSWIGEFDVAEWRRQYAAGVRGDGVFALEYGLVFIAGGRDIEEGIFPWQRAWSRFANWMMRPLLKSQVLENMKLYRRLESLYPLPYYLQRAQFEKLRPESDELPWYKKPLGQFFPNYQSAFLKEASLEAVTLATEAGLACKIYKNKYGRYPENLDALVPEILDKVPIDPFSDKPLVYKLTADEVLVYSLGSNEKDDGGRQTYNLTQLVMEKDDDWAWREKIQP
jgi:hypothetical protein